MSFHVKYSFQKVFTSNQSSSTTKQRKILIADTTWTPFTGEILFILPLDNKCCLIALFVQSPVTSKSPGFKNVRGKVSGERRNFFQEKENHSEIFKNVRKGLTNISRNIQNHLKWSYKYFHRHSKTSERVWQIYWEICKWIRKGLTNVFGNNQDH